MAPSSRKYLKTILKLLLLLVLALVSVVLVRTGMTPSRQWEAAAIEKITVDSGAAGRLAQSLTFSTISTEAGVDTQAFHGLDSFMRNSYPLVYQHLEAIPMGPFSHLFRWPGKNSQLLPVLLMGHTDVVPIEESTRDRWEAPPFGGVIKDGYIWGRGVLDDKVAVFGLLEAVEHLLKEGHAPERDLYFAFGHDEETGGEGAKSMAALLESRNIRFEYILDEGQLILEKALSGLEPPLAMIGIAEKGYATLTLTAQLPVGGHSSMPPRETAVSILSNAIVRLTDNPMPARIDGATAGFFEYIGPEMSLPYRGIFANLWLTEPLLIRMLGADPASGALIRTTTAPTLLRGGVKENVLPSTASAKVNFRILPGDSVASVIAHVRQVIADPRVIVSENNKNFSSNPTPISPTKAFGFETIHKTIRQVFPEVVVSPALVIAATDARHYSRLSDCIYRFLPIRLQREELSRLHGVNERLGEENYRQAVRFYRQLILNSSSER